jgi:hypothetical protein
MQLSTWRTQLGLGPAIGATFFTIDTSSGTAGNIGGESAAGIGAPPKMISLASLAILVVGFIIAM